jgi:hypothetical protein
MAKIKSSILSACIMCAMHTGYRRAGIAFDKGENTVEIDETQLVQIEQDKNLLVQSVESIEPGSNNDTQGNVDDGLLDSSVKKPSLDNTTLDLAHAPEALNAIIATIHAKNCETPLTKKPNCDEFGELKVSGADRDAAWDWYQDNVVNHVPDGNQG